MAASKSADELSAAAESDDWRTVAGLIDRCWIDLTLGGELEAMGNAVARMPEHELLRSVSAGLVAENIGRLDPGTIDYELPAAANELEAIGRSGDAHLALMRSLAAMAGRRRRGEHASAAEFARRGAVIAAAAEFAGFPDTDSLLPFWHLQAGITAHLAGDDGLARRLHRAAYLGRDRSRFDIVGRDAAANMALLEATAGNHLEARAWLDRAGEESHAPTWVDPLIGTTISAAEGIVAWDRLDVDGIRTFVRDSGTTIDHDEHWASLLGARVGIELAFGHPATAQELIDRAREAHARWIGISGYGVTVLAVCSAEVAMARGRGVPARRALEDVAPDEPMAVLSRARLALLTGDLETVDLLARQSLPGTDLSLRHRLEVLLVAALASERRGDHPRAVERLASAVRLHHHHELLRPFTAVPSDFLRSVAPDVPGLDAIITALEAVQVRDIYPPAVQTVELTERESALLAVLDTDDPLPGVADRMSLSVNTVRTHLSSLRRKLDARSRSEVVANARRHGLLR